jgi:DNA-binding protein WhiA
MLSCQVRPSTVCVSTRAAYDERGRQCLRVSLSEDLRNELAQIAPERACDRLAELSALFHSAGSEHFRGRGEVAVHLDLGSPAGARRAFSLLRSFDVPCEVRTYRQRAFQQATRFQLHIAGDPRALQLLHEAGVLDARLAPLERPPARVVARSCCRRAYLRGALLAAGSLSAGHALHLEIRATGLAGAEFLCAVAAREGVTLHTAERATHVAAYAKGAEPVEAILALAGASTTVLALEERAVMAGTRARANRLANADHANLVRTSRAAHAQMQAIQRLRASGELDRLDGALQDAAGLRVRYPTLPLSELASRSGVTKPTLARRLAALVAAASEE